MVIVLVVFGSGRLGEVGSALGKGQKDFRSTQTHKCPEVEATQARR